MEMYYWTGFSKRKNSTKLPSDAGTKIDIVLKEDTNEENPTIILSGHDRHISYVFLPEFGKYYFVSSPTILTDNMTQYDLEEDYLASHKTGVGSTVAHIVYSSTGWDKDLVDGRIAIKGTKEIFSDPKTLGFNSTGCYVIGYVNNQNDGKMGALSYSVMSTSEMASMIGHMMETKFFDDLVQHFSGKVLDFIQSCIWVPIDGSGFVSPTASSRMYLGSNVLADYSVTPPAPYNIFHYPVITPVARLGGIVSLSLGSKYQDFRDSQPYTSISLYLPGVGLVDLNANDLYSSDNINVETIFDITTGDCTYRLYTDDNELIKTVSFNASASVSLSQTNMNSAGVLGAIGGTAGGVIGLGAAVAGLNPVGVATAGVGILAGASAALMAANQRSTSIKGTNSGRSSFFDVNAVSVVFRQYTEDPDDANYIAKFGRPVGLTHAINNHSGYVQCENASVDIVGSSSERDAINGYLNSGFYYE